MSQLSPSGGGFSGGGGFGGGFAGGGYGVNAALADIFLVHGRDEATRRIVEGFLNTILGKPPIILAEQPNAGRTIIEKFEASLATVRYAIVLMTPDDFGGLKESPSPDQARARQNVIFELGYFAGRLGRNNVCLLTKGKLEMPSDLHGIVYTPLDRDDVDWKASLIQEIENANIKLDTQRVIKAYKET